MATRTVVRRVVDCAKNPRYQEHSAVSAPGWIRQQEMNNLRAHDTRLLGGRGDRVKVRIGEQVPPEVQRQVNALQARLVAQELHLKITGRPKPKTLQDVLNAARIK